MRRQSSLENFEGDRDQTRAREAFTNRVNQIISSLRRLIMRGAFVRGIFNIFLCVVLWSLAIVLTSGIAIILLAIWAFVVFFGTDARSENAENQLARTLMADEHLIYYAVQYRVFALFKRRAFLGITDSRVVRIARGLFGGFRMSDIQWKDLTDAQLEQNVVSSLCGSNLKFYHSNGSVPQIVFEGVEDAAASDMYSKAQSEEQSWEEKRRIRKIEEARAVSGGITLHTGNSQPINAASSASPNNQMFEEITNAKKLFDSGIISDSEFQEMKSKIISRS